MTDNREMLKIAVKALEDKKGSNIKIIDISKISVIADYFVIVSGSNANQLRAMADEIEEKLGRAGLEPKQKEGYDAANWILMDYRDFIIHIFNSEQRLYYDIERIWSDGKSIEIDNL